MEVTPGIVASKFTERFKGEPIVIRAPGRINLIGEHTDYNDGFVMPAAVDKEIFFGVGPSVTGRSVIYSINYNEVFEVDLRNIRRVDAPLWANYLLGVLHQLDENGYSVKSFNCVFGGNIPPGAGMSSSAALECGFAVAMRELNNLDVPKMKLVTMSQWAEHHYAGVKCGIMDQFASVMGKRGNVIVLDCRTLEHQYAPLDLNAYRIVLCDTKVKHSLVDSEYNNRRNECETGVKILRTAYPQVTSLRDVSMGMLDAYRDELGKKVHDRCRYVVEEIARVQEATTDLQNGELDAFGEKMYATHDGLSRLYEVSCDELDFLVEEARKSGWVAGARMMGGGFGGCTINLVKAERIDSFVHHMTLRYKKSFNIDLAVYKVSVVDGVSRLS